MSPLIYTLRNCTIDNGTKGYGKKGFLMIAYIRLKTLTEGQYQNLKFCLRECQGWFVLPHFQTFQSTLEMRLKNTEIFWRVIYW